MKISNEDAALFKKLHIKNLLDLALFLPKKLENLTFSAAPSEEICTEDVRILRINSHNGKILGSVWCKNWELEASFIIFHASRWHFGAFKAGKECIFNAKMNLYNGIWQFANPKIISKAGFFVPKYQCAGIKDESIARLIRTYITRENLQNSGLNEKRVDLLLSLHAYDEKSFRLLNALKIKADETSQNENSLNLSENSRKENPLNFGENPLNLNENSGENSKFLQENSKNLSENLQNENPLNFNLNSQINSQNLSEFSSNLNENSSENSKNSQENSQFTNETQKKSALEILIEKSNQENALKPENPRFKPSQNEINNMQKDLKFIEIYNFLRRLRTKKQTPKSYEIELFDISAWLESLPFRPTKDQMQAINDIKGDLRSRDAKRRVIMGDVGCGKTLVLLAAALLVYPKQAVLMSPTSILAAQIFDEAKRLLPKFMQIELLKGGKKDKDTPQRLAKAHLIIGTHAIIHLNALNAVLVMVDEQHRFGSNQRQKINDLAKNDELSPHFVQFSATPIPRTLSMVQSELVSFSFIRQMPFRKDIQTFCVQGRDFALILERINDELKKGNQIAIIYPLVNESTSENAKYLPLERAREYWEKRYDGVFSTHGKDKNKEEVLLEFRQKGRILLATTVMEVGISLPKLSTIIIVGAEKLGLATLHQLRGRVGRVGLPSFCYLYTKLDTMPQRLIEFSKTLDGFVIAELDLKNRLSGDLLDGFAQHGNEFKFFDFATDEKILSEAKASLREYSG